MVVRNREGNRELALVQWGLIPSWSRPESLGNRPINARAETVADRPTFRDAFRRRRCIIPADGFYEWTAKDAVKRPIYIDGADGAPLALAAIWERWHTPGHDAAETFAILTTEANALMRPIHDRMPVILPPELWDRWLEARPQEVGDQEAAWREAQSMCVPCPDGLLRLRPVSRLVNSPRNDTPECIAPVDPELETSEAKQPPAKSAGPKRRKKATDPGDTTPPLFGNPA